LLGGGAKQVFAIRVLVGEPVSQVAILFRARSVLHEVVQQIVLISDEVLYRCHHPVAGYFKGKAEVWYPDRPVGCLFDLMAELHEWVLRRQPSVVHLASGLKDTRTVCYGCEQTLSLLEHYQENVERLLEIILERSTATPIWATIPPVDMKRLKNNGESDSDFEYDNETIIRFNEQGREAAAKLGVEVNDLYGTVKAASREQSQRPDAVHFGEVGRDLISSKMIRCIEQVLAD